MAATVAQCLISSRHSNQTFLPRHAGHMLTAAQSAAEVVWEAAECQRAQEMHPQTFGPQCSCSEGPQSADRHKYHFGKLYHIVYHLFNYWTV